MISKRYEIPKENSISISPMKCIFIRWDSFQALFLPASIDAQGPSISFVVVRLYNNMSLAYLYANWFAMLLKRVYELACMLKMHVVVHLTVSH